MADVILVALAPIFFVMALGFFAGILYPNEARSMTLAILCSGQGPQHPNMFALTGDAPEAANLFTRAATLLGGHDPRAIVQTDPDEAIHQNRVGQILCTLQALAATATLRNGLPPRLIVAGYSVGEVAAWSVAGLMDARIALDLVARRAEAMDAASMSGDGLLFVRGLSRGAVEDLCKRHDAAIAIINPGDAYVLGGTGEALDIMADEGGKMGAARIVRLAVNVAAHTPRLATASVEFGKALDQTPMKHKPDAGVRLFSGIDGSPVVDIGAGVEKLAKQISHTVQWGACLEGCAEAGASAFLELGPGRALSEMAASSYRDIPARSLEEFRTLQGARAWLDSVVS
jgi:[acyl-carrier-protein] S-malonyltransferase